MPTKIPLAPVEGFQPGSRQFFSVDRLDICVLRLPDGDFRAVLNRCPHKGAPIGQGPLGGTWAPSAPGELVFERAGEILACPWHGREFDLRTGNEIYCSSPARLRLYPVIVEDGMVTILK